MIDKLLAQNPNRWLVWLGGILCIAVGVGSYAVLAGNSEFGAGQDRSPMHVEEFRVAEPLTTDGSTALQDQLQIITAVTEPYDDVEAAVDSEDDELARTRADFELQCITVLKEMAFCTTEDAFLELIGTAPNLRESAERERFMNRVQHWFEPGGARAECSKFLAREQARRQEAKEIWQRASGATELLCTDFAEILLEAHIFAEVGELWE